MLGIWRCHTEYQRFMVDIAACEFKRNPNAIKRYETAFLKMYLMNLDSVRSDFAPLLSVTGKPSNQQSEIFRSLLLLSHFKYAGLEEWITYAKSSVLLFALVGVTPGYFVNLRTAISLQGFGNSTLSESCGLLQESLKPSTVKKSSRQSTTALSNIFR